MSDPRSGMAMMAERELEMKTNKQTRKPDMCRGVICHMHNSCGGKIAPRHSGERCDWDPIKEALIGMGSLTKAIVGIKPV